MYYLFTNIKKSIKRKVIRFKLNQLHVNNSFRLNDDGSIDLFGDVSVACLGLKELPIRINEVQGYFDCSGNNLTTLKNAPKAVMRHFYCRNNLLKTLEGCPEIIGGAMYAETNNITSLEFLPLQIKSSIHLQDNPIRELTGIKELPNKTVSNFNIYLSNKSFNKDEILFYISQADKLALKDELISSLNEGKNGKTGKKLKV